LWFLLFNKRKMLCYFLQKILLKLNKVCVNRNKKYSENSILIKDTVKSKIDNDNLTILMICLTIIKDI